MTDHKFEKKFERDAVLFDFKNRIIDMLENGVTPPEVGIYDEPVRYLKMNQEWFKLLAGWLSWMESVAYWKDAEDETYPGIQAILEFEEGIDLPTGDFDCGDVEDCLGESTIITEITNNITENTTNITNITNQVDDLEDCGCGGNNYPPPEDDYEGEQETPGNSKICGSAAYIADHLYSLIAQTIDDSLGVTLEEFLEGLLGLGGFDASLLKLFWDYIVTITNPDLANDCLSFQPSIAEAFFCNLLDRDAARAAIEADSALPDDVKQAYLAALDSVNDAKLALWAFVGAETQAYDCSEFCSWKVYWVFDGSVIEDEEPHTVYTGVGAWTSNDAELLAAGWASTDGDMELSHDLPPDCKVNDIAIRAGKHNACGTLVWNYTWRGATGTGTQAQSGSQFIGFADGVATANVHHAELTSMMVATLNSTCSGATPPREHVGWIMLSGTGSKPSA